jgi:hypothetical protein
MLRDLPVVKISPEWVTGPEQVKSSGRFATFSLWTGMFRVQLRDRYMMMNMLRTVS